MRIVPGDFGDPRVIALLRIARAEMAPGSAHALDATAQQARDISVLDDLGR